MKLYVDNNPNDAVTIPEDRSAYAYAGVLVGLGLAMAGLIYIFI